MNKRGRPKLKRKPEDVLLSSGLTARQTAFMRDSFSAAGFVSAADFHRWILQQFIEKISLYEAGVQDKLDYEVRQEPVAKALSSYLRKKRKG